MNMRFYLSDLPEYNLMPNGDMSQNNSWSVFGHREVQCWQSANVSGAGLCWYVNKGEAARGVTAGLRSGAFTLTQGQYYHLSLWVYLSQGTPSLPQVSIYADDDTVMTSGNDYTLSYNGWQQMNLTFAATKDTDKAFLAVVYEGAALGAFYLDNTLLYPATAEITEIEIRPDWNIDLGRTASMTKTRSQAGRLFLYDWNQYAKKSISLDFVPAAQAQIINRFWQNRTKLLLKTMHNNTLSDYILGVITDDKTPLNQYQAPYTEYYRGKLTFEEL